MAEYRNQHYVPQFYLKNFSENKKSIYRYSIERKVLERRQISKTCALHYFYAKPSLSPESEKLLSGIEDVQSGIVNNILMNGKVSDLPIEDSLNLRQFVLFTSARTNASKKMGEKFATAWINKLMIPIWSQSEEFQKTGFDPKKHHVEVTRDGANSEDMICAINGAILLLDLKATLLINKTGRSFITSDNPTIRYNFITFKSLPLNGHGNPGLLLFLPLSGRITLCFYES
jgi:hypothetical protein